MYESELVDILVGISEGNYIVEQRQVQKGSKQAEEAKQVMAVLAYRGMKLFHFLIFLIFQYWIFVVLLQDSSVLDNRHKIELAYLQIVL
jgi:hypothetical protein